MLYTHTNIPTYNTHSLKYRGSRHFRHPSVCTVVLLSSNFIVIVCFLTFALLLDYDVSPAISEITRKARVFEN